MSLKEDQLHVGDNGLQTGDLCSTIKNENLVNYQATCDSSDKEGTLPTCRVCQCSESDSKGDIALGYLNIIPPLTSCVESCIVLAKSYERKSGVIEFVSTEGKVFLCSTTDLEAGSYDYQNIVIDLGCSCKNDLALAHYACALKWFINHGSTVCEICGSLAKNIRLSDFKKVVSSLKDYESLREGTFSGEPTLANLETHSGVDTSAANRRQRLSEISLFFNPNIINTHTTTTFSQGSLGPNSNILIEDVFASESPATKWAVEGTGILVATGLLTVTLAWLIAPRVGKRIAKNGLHILLGGICALTVVLFLRFINKCDLCAHCIKPILQQCFECRVSPLDYFLKLISIVLSRIKYGPARYWAILFVFWFLVFGIWASRTHGTHSS